MPQAVLEQEVVDEVIDLDATDLDVPDLDVQLEYVRTLTGPVAWSSVDH